MAKWIAATTLLAAQMLLGTAMGQAQEPYPSRPVRVICGFPAGTSADIMARIYAQKLSEKYGQQFVVENRLGASGNLAAEAVARADADGYTLLLGTVANSISASALKNLSHDFGADFSPIAVVSSAPNILVVSEGTGVTSVQGLVKLAKERSDLFFGSAGVGTAPHLSGELFNMMTGAKLTHVPYRGNSQGLVDLVSGRLHAIFAPAPTLAAFVQDQRVKALAVTSAKRSSQHPDTTDTRRIRVAWLRYCNLVWLSRAEGHITANPQACRRRLGRSWRKRGREGAARSQRRRAALDHTRQVRRLHCGGHQEVAYGRRVRADQELIDAGYG